MMSDEHRIESPCIRKCCLDNNDVCLGCFRTIDEITGWSQANETLRQQFLDNAGKRTISYKLKYAGHK